MTTMQQRKIFSATRAPVPELDSNDPTRAVFEHWVVMFGRAPGRTKLGPTRRAVISAALTLYDVETLQLAIDGMAADPLADCTNDRIRDAMREIEWLLGREARIERWADRGEQLRAEVEALVADQARVALDRAAGKVPEADQDPDAVRSAREALREQRRRLAATKRCGAVHGG